MRSLKSPKHPRISQTFGLFLAQFGLGRLIVGYFLLLACFGTLGALGIFAVSSKSRSFTDTLQFAISSLFAPEYFLQERGESIAYYAFAALLSAGATLAPVLLLGAFVFKLFVRDPLVWRSMPTLEDRPRVGAVLAIRFYNGTRAPLYDLTVRVYARIASTRRPILIENRPLQVIAGEGRSSAREFVTASPGNPFTVRVPIGESLERASTVARGSRIELQGRSVSKDRVKFRAVVTGTLGITATPFISVRDFPAPEMSHVGAFQPVDVDLDTPIKSWSGWENFEGFVSEYLFVYGSLVALRSLERTLGRAALPAEKPVRARLDGWQLTWNSGSNRESHPERFVSHPDGTPFTGVLISLGLTKVHGATCFGAVFEVNSQTLSLLDERERNYELIDVTSSVSWTGKPENCRVQTYVPLEASSNRAARAIQDHNAAVRAGYLSMIERAFRELSGDGPDGEAYLIPDAPCPIVELKLDADREVH